MHFIHWTERLSTVLAERGLTQDQFARRIGKSQATVSRWITRSSNPRIEVEQRIADELGISRQWLMSGEGDKLSKRISANKSSNATRISASRRAMWRHEKEEDESVPHSAEDIRLREMLASIRLLIGDYTDLQIIARIRETLEDKNFSMPYRINLAQALLDELYHRHHIHEPPAP